MPHEEGTTRERIAIALAYIGIIFPVVIFILACGISASLLIVHP